MQYLGRVEGENGFKVYLAWLESICYLLSKNSAPLLFPGVFGYSFNTSCHADYCFRTSISFHRLGTREFVWHQVSTSSHGDLSLFPLTKRAILPALRLRPIIWLLPPHPPPHSVVLRNDLHSLLRPTKLGLWNADNLTYIATWIRYFVQQADR